jgi:integrase
MPKVSASRLRVPTYRRHRPTGQAVVTLNGRDFYLGPWNSKASRVEYDRLIGEWLAAGRSIPRPESDLTIAELAVRYLRFAKTYYVQDGQPTESLDRVKTAIRLLKEAYAHTLVRDFGPLALQAIQGKLAASGRSRGYCNHLTEQIKRVFKWGVSQELVPESVYRALTTVPGLKIGRTEAREPEAVEPVADELIQATLPYLPAPIAAMVQFQRLTGCRPGEVCLLRPIDVDRSGEVWTFTPPTHKTAYRGKTRTIFIGPKAQAILLPWLLRDPESCCFCPQERVRKWNAQRRAKRQTPMTPSQAKRRRKRNPKRAPGVAYTTRSYARAIARAIDAANKQREEKKLPPLAHWHLNQLRHTAATEIRKAYSLEAVQAVLGHAHMKVSEIYAEKNLALAAEIMRKLG